MKIRTLNSTQTQLKANKVEVWEYDVFMNDFHLCTLESAWSGLVSMSAVPGPLKQHTLHVQIIIVCGYFSFVRCFSL